MSTFSPPQISIVIPLFNKERHVARAINSVLKQAVDGFEIVVVDDGSTDNGRKIVESIVDPRIEVIVQTNQGVSAARNRGIEAARADLIAFLDADDEWHPHHAETLLNLSKEFPQAGAYATAYEVVEADGTMRTPNFFGVPLAPWEGILENYFISAAFGNPPVWTSAVAVPRKIFQSVGGFKVGARLGQDLDMWGRIALKYPIAFSRTVGARYHKAVENSAISKPYADSVPPFVESAREALAQGKVPDSFLEALREYVARIQLYSIKRNVNNGYRAIALRQIRDCNTRKFRFEKWLWHSYALLPHSLHLKFCRFRKTLKRFFLNRHQNTRHSGFC